MVSLKMTTIDTLGIQLVPSLIEQFDGEINTDTTNGTKYLIKFDKLTLKTCLK